MCTSIKKYERAFLIHLYTLFGICSQFCCQSNLDLGLKWGKGMECLDSVTLSVAKIEDCYTGCLIRPGCLSFDYSLRRQQCRLCPQDNETGTVIEMPGFVHSDKYSWTQSRRTTSCNCDAGEVCEILASGPTCKIKECPTHPIAKAEKLHRGNMKRVGNTLIYWCPATPGEPAVMTSSCRPDGTWTMPSQPVEFICHWYVGCFTEPYERNFAVKFVDYAMTNDMCFDKCRGHYADPDLFYYGTEAGVECFCGDHYPIYPLAEDDNQCEKSCGGHLYQICGGSWRISVRQYFRMVTP